MLQRIRPQNWRDGLLLILLTLFWGINWPVMKDAVRELPPLFFRSISMTGGVIALGVWLLCQKGGWRACLMPRQHVGDVVLLAIPNMVIWHLFAIYGVTLLASGRAAVLGYTMPLWAALAAVWLLRERLARRHWLGLCAGALGIVLLLASEWQRLAIAPVGTVFMLIAAAAWGLGTVLLRKMPIPVESTVLTWWMLVITTPCMWLASIVLEWPGWLWPTGREWVEILYNALVVFAFCHVVWFRLARTLPPVISSLSIMLIPVVGVVAGMLWLGERPHWQDYAALLMLLVALAMVLGRPATSPASHAS
ncbi:DMT family transporter [Parvibium lacunae]|uniref:DMT family transporter n=2 Tax=Parvibium lacunae TaxID=1888893 RepID=A0A368L2B0_9BURK|nr:DMT family transporter [Parvibium lacunae]